VRKMRTAISPRFATSTFEKGGMARILPADEPCGSVDARSHRGGACRRRALRLGLQRALLVGDRVFIAAMTTDWFDSRVARWRGRTSPLGSLLDPVADKVLVLTMLIMLVDAGVCPGWMVAAIVAREFLVSGLRLAAIERAGS
jgi:phosphatidylglycerophosphate synthase